MVLFFINHQRYNKMLRRIAKQQYQHQQALCKQYATKAITVPQKKTFFLEQYSKYFAPRTHLDQEMSEKSNTIISHQLLVRAGFIRQLSSGIYHIMPMGLRVLDKITAIIDEELQAIGCQKMVMPLLLDSEIWKQSGRWHTASAEVSNDYVLTPFLSDHSSDRPQATSIYFGTNTRRSHYFCCCGHDASFSKIGTTKNLSNWHQIS